MAMTHTSFNFNINAVPFVPQEEQNAALALAALQRGDHALSETIEALMALRLDDNSNEEEENSDYEPMDIDSNPEHEYEDAFLEYAQVNGLWGLPGSEIIPTEEEMTNMRQNFDEHWNNMSEANDTNESMDIDPNPENEYEDAFLEYAQVNGLWGLPGSEIIPTEEEMTNMRDNFDEHWNNLPVQQMEEEDRTAVWIETAADFQDYTDDMMPHLDPNSETADEDYMSAWIQYLEDCYDPLSYEYLEELGDENNWIGVRPGAEPLTPQL